MNEARSAKVGEKKLLILQTIAEMLERPAADKVTTALLAKQLQVSEAALYRHFASKAQMYEGLIEFIETGVFSVITQIEAAEESGLKQAEAIVASLLHFAQKNRGLANASSMMSKQRRACRPASTSCWIASKPPSSSA